MFWTVLALISLVVLGGFISYYGDLQGRRWGKKRVSWFGLRPKYTAVLITSLTGAFVALLSIATLLAVAPAIRGVVWEGERAIQQSKALNSQLIDQRLENERELRDLNTRLADTQGEYTHLTERYSRLLKEMDEQKRVAVGLRANNKELNTKYTTLKDEQTKLELVLQSEKNQVASLQAKQKTLASAIKTAETQVLDAGHLNMDLGKENVHLTGENGKLIKLQKELEGKVADAQSSLAMLRETNATLKGEGERLQDKNNDLVKQNLALYETNRRSEDYNRELRLKNDQLLASNTNLRQQQNIYLANLRDASETVGAIRQGTLILRAGGELARRVLSDHSRPEAIQRELHNLLDDAHYAALTLKAGIGDNKRAVRIISKRIVTQAGFTDANEDASIAALTDELIAKEVPVVVIANAVSNSLAGEQVTIELTPYAVKEVYKKDDVVASSIIDTRQPVEKIVDSIVRFLQQDVAQAAISAGVIARIDPETGTQQIGIAVARDLVVLTERVRKVGGRVRLTAHSEQAMSSADSLRLRFDTGRVSASEKPELMITAPGSRGSKR